MKLNDDIKGYADLLAILDACPGVMISKEDDRFRVSAGPLGTWTHPDLHVALGLAAGGLR